MIYCGTQDADTKWIQILDANPVPFKIAII